MSKEFPVLPLLESLRCYEQIRLTIPEACKGCELAEHVAVTLGIMAARMQLDVDAIQQQYGEEMSFCSGQVQKRSLIPFKAKKASCPNSLECEDFLVPNIFTQVNNPNNMPS